MTSAPLGTAVVRIEGDDSGFDKSLDSAKRKAEGLGGVMKNALGTAAGFAAAQAGMSGLAGGFDFLIGNAASFEKSLNAVQAATGATNDEMESMNKLALKIGADTSKSASEAVLAMGELAKAGMDVETILNGGAMAAVNLAEATGIDVPSAAILVSNSMNTWKDAGYSASNVANILATAANASAIDVTDLGQSLAAVGPVASSAGLTMHDFATAIGLMGNNAMRGSDAGTSLKAFLSGLTPSSEKAADAMAEIGFSAFDAEGNFKSMKQIIGELGGSLEGMTEQQRATTLELLFGSDGVRAANILLKEGVEGWNEFGEAMDTAPDIAEQSRIRMQGLAGQWEMFMGSVETISITIGTLLIPALTKLMQLIIDITNAIIPAVQAFLGFEPVQVAFRALADAAKAIPIEIFEGLAVALALIGAKIIIGGLIALTAAVVGLTISFIAMNITIIAFVAAIALLAAGIIYAIKHWDDIKRAATSALQTIYDFVMKYLPLILAGFLGPLGILVGFVIKHFDEIKDAVVNAFNSVIDFITGAWETIKSAFNSALQAIVGFVTDHWKTILVAFTGPLGLLIIAVVNHFETIKGAVQAAMTFIQGIITTVWTAIQAAVTAVVTAIAGFITQQFNQTKADLQAIWDAISGAASAAWQAVYDFVAPKVQAIYDFVTGVFNDLKEIVVGIAQDIEAEVSSAFSSVALKAEEAWNYLRDRVSAAIKAAYDFIAPIVDQIVKLGDKVMGVVGKVTGAVGSVTGAAGKVGGAIFGTEGWASGGHLGMSTVGRPQIVGERGWELWVPDRPGTILNHEDSMAALGGGAGGGVQVSMPNAIIYARDELEAYQSMQGVGYGISTAAALRGTRR